MTATKPAKLPAFEEHDVTVAAIRITRCGDGLSAALEVDPKAYDLGDRVSFVITGDVAQINHKDKDGVVTRLHTVETTGIAEVSRDVAQKMLQEEAQRIETLKAARDGQLSLEAEAAAEERERADRASTGNARRTNTTS